MCPTAIGNFALTTQNFFELKQLSRFSIRWQQLLRTYDFERARVPPKQYARSEISFLCEVIATGSNGGLAPGYTLDNVFLHLRTHFPEGAHYLGQCNITHEQTYITIYVYMAFAGYSDMYLCHDAAVLDAWDIVLPRHTCR